MSPIIFLISFNPLLKLAADLNYGHGYTIELPIQGSENLPPLNASVSVKWMEESDEPPGWYRARVAVIALVGLYMMILRKPLLQR